MSFERIVEVMIKDGVERGKFKNLARPLAITSNNRESNALQIVHALLYFLSLKLTFSAPFS